MRDEVRYILKIWFEFICKDTIPLIKKGGAGKKEG
jgi:hypothetical protein